jgi:hypothetical protein
MCFPYSIEEIRRGVRHPSKIKREISEQARQIKYGITNKRKEWEQREKSSAYGLVLNWGLHQRDHWTAACYPFFVEQFINRFDPLIITSQKDYNRHAEELDYIFAFGVRNIKGPTIEYDTSLDQITLVFASDPHNRSKFLYKYIQKNEINYVLTPLYNPVLYHLPEITEERVVHFPWPVPEQHIIEPDRIEFHDDDAVHISGAGGSEAYELRDWCRRQPNVVEHSNSGTQNKTMTNDEYYRWLRNFDAGIAAGSLEEQWQYVVPKYYEIPAAGSLLFAQYCKDLERLGFDESNCVIFHSKDEFREELGSYLDEPESYLDRRRRGAELINSEYTVSDRLRDIEELFKDKYE